MITATKEPKTCRGFNLRRHPIFTGFEYVKLRRGKFLCKECRDTLEANRVDKQFFTDLINFK